MYTQLILTEFSSLLGLRESSEENDVSEPDPQILYQESDSFMKARHLGVDKWREWNEPTDFMDMYDISGNLRANCNFNTQFAIGERSVTDLTRRSAEGDRGKGDYHDTVHNGLMIRPKEAERTHPGPQDPRTRE